MKNGCRNGWVFVFQAVCASLKQRKLSFLAGGAGMRRLDDGVNGIPGVSFDLSFAGNEPTETATEFYTETRIEKSVNYKIAMGCSNMKRRHVSV